MYQKPKISLPKLKALLSRLLSIMSNYKHIAILSFPFGSHSRTILNLVSKLVMVIPEAHFSFFNTAKSNESLLTTSESNLQSNIKVYNISDGIPLGHVLTDDPLEPIDLFLKATPKNFQTGIDIAIKETGKNITCLITDGFFLFSADLAINLGNIPWIPLWVPIPSALSAHIYTNFIRSNIICTDSNENRTVEFIPGLSGIKISNLPEEVTCNEMKETVFSTTLSQIGLVLPQATAIVMNSYEQLYPPMLIQDLKSKFQNFLNIGFLTVPMPPKPLQMLDQSDPTCCLAWLEGQRMKSVAYIGFGTTAKPSTKEVIELAEAIEEYGVPFLWSFRGNLDSLDSLSKNGFVERTRKHGKIVSWAPQDKVLAHSSIDVFVTHCGCNSVYESVANGVPMICRPFFGDHKTTAWMVEEVWKVGVRVGGNVFTKSGVLISFKLILGNGLGKEIRANAKTLKEIVVKAAQPNETAAKDFKILVDIITAGRNNKFVYGM